MIITPGLGRFHREIDCEPGRPLGIPRAAFSMPPRRIIASIHGGSKPAIRETKFNHIRRNPIRLTSLWSGGMGNNKSGRKIKMADQSLDARRIARDQESRIASASAYCMNATKPVIQCQASMLRLWADNFEMFVRNYEKGVETFCSTIEEQLQRAA
jgi:hypothetical protein